MRRRRQGFEELANGILAVVGNLALILIFAPIALLLLYATADLFVKSLI